MRRWVSKWLLPEENSDLARRLLDLYQDDKIDLRAPSILIPEVSRVLTKRTRRREITVAEAKAAFEYLLLNAPVPVETYSILQSAFHLSTAHQASYYGCLYLAVALEQRCDLVTAAGRFYTTPIPALSTSTPTSSLAPDGIELAFAEDTLNGAGGEHLVSPELHLLRGSASYSLGCPGWQRSELCLELVAEGLGHARSHAFSQALSPAVITDFPEDDVLFDVDVGTHFLRLHFELFRQPPQAR